MADVRVRYVGKAPIVVNGLTWLEGETHTINEKLAQSLLAFGERVVVLPAVGAGGLVVEGTDGTNVADGIDGVDDGDRTSMKVMLMRLVTPTEEAAGEMAELGLSVAEGAETAVVEEKPARRKRK